MAEDAKNVVFSVTLSELDWEPRSASWRCHALAIPGANLLALQHDGRNEDPRNFKQVNGTIQWAGPDHIPKELIATVELTKDLENIEAEKLVLENQKYTLEQEKVELERQKVAIEKKKLAAENRWKVITAAGAIFAFAAGYILKPSPVIPVPVPTPVPTPAYVDQSLKDLVEEGVRSGRQYVIESIVMLVDLDAPGSVTGKIAAARATITYTVFALTDSPTFDEAYHTAQSNTKLSRIRGSLSEGPLLEQTPAEIRWDVISDMKKGERKTLVTSVEYVSRLPFPSKRTIHDFSLLTPAEDVWCYPNDEDVVGEVTLLIRSSSSILPPTNGDMLRVDHSKGTAETKINDTPVLSRPDGQSNAMYVLAGRWKNVRRGEYVEIHFARH